MSDFGRAFRRFTYRHRFLLGRSAIVLGLLGAAGVALGAKPALLAVFAAGLLFALASYNVHHGSGGGDADARLMHGGGSDVS